MEIKEVVQDVRLQEWAVNIQVQKASGLSVRAWCKENDIGQGSYYYWLNKLRNLALNQYTDGTFEEKTFVPVQVPTPISTDQKGTANSPITIRKGKISIELNNDTPLSTITTILETLQC